LLTNILQTTCGNFTKFTNYEQLVKRLTDLILRSKDKWSNNSETNKVK